MQIACARCNAPLPLDSLANTDEVTCAWCTARNTVRVFAALRGGSAPALPETAAEGEAVCFDHPSKRAVAACHQCGRFVCSLCSVESSGLVWCPACVASGKGQGKAVYLDPSRMLFDSIAMSLPLVSLVVWPVTILTGPATIVFTAMTWKRPLSVVRKSHWRFVVGLLLGCGETIGWIWLLVYWWESFRMGKG